MKVIASTRPKRPYLKNADIIRVNGAYIFKNELIDMMSRYNNKQMFIDIPTKREKVTISDISIIDVIELCTMKYNINTKIKNIIAFSKVESVNDITLGDSFLTCSKIESFAGITHLKEIVRFSDIICIDRVDLINEIGIKQYLIYEDYIIQTTHAAGKEIFIASDILPSLITSKNPSLPEMIQLKHYQDKKVDGIILAEETAVGFYPYHAIEVVKSLEKKKIKIEADAWETKNERR